MINLVVEPFDDVVPCDNYWLQISFRKMTSEFITLEELKKLDL